MTQSTFDKFEWLKLLMRATNRTISPGAKVVGFVLANYCYGDKCECFPSLARIGKDTGVNDRKTTRERIKELIAAGYLERKERRGRMIKGTDQSNTYTLKMPAGSTLSACEIEDDPALSTQENGGEITPFSDCEKMGGVSPLQEKMGGVSPENGGCFSGKRSETPPPNLLVKLDVNPPSLEGEIIRPESGSWEEFKSNYPWQKTDSHSNAHDFFKSMPMKDRQAAVRFAGDYGEAAHAANRKIKNAENWLKGRGWEVFADDDRTTEASRKDISDHYAGKVWVEQGTPQAEAWKRHYGKSQFYFTREAFDGKRGTGRAETSEWPPGLEPIFQPDKQPNPANTLEYTRRASA